MNEKRPLIGITTWTLDRNEPHPGRFIHSNVQYMQAVRLCGGVPIYLSGDQAAEDELSDVLDGLILSGGPDIEPWRYGRENEGSMEPDIGRDEYEISLARDMVRKGKAVLGICRGIQVLNVALGGTLIQDNDTFLGINHPNGHGKRHELRISEDCFMFPFFDGAEKITVNSTHHQSCEIPGKGMKATGWSEDGVIEVIQVEDGRPLYGVQFHPERIFRSRGESILGIFRALVKGAAKG